MKPKTIGSALCVTVLFLVLSVPAFAQSVIASNCVKVEHFPPPADHAVHDLRVTNICDFRIHIRMFYTHFQYGKNWYGCQTSAMEHAAYVNGPFSPGESRWSWAGGNRESDLDFEACAYNVDLAKSTDQGDPCWSTGTRWGEQCEYFWQGFRAQPMHAR